MQPTAGAAFNMADYFLYDRLAEGRGDRVAMRTDADAWTYARAAAESNRFGNALRELGVAAGDRVLLSLPDVPEFAAGIFGTLRMGGVVAMVNPLLPAEDLAYYVEYTGCRAMLCDESVAQKLAPMLPRFMTLKDLVVLGGAARAAGAAGDRVHAYGALVSGQPPRCEPAPTRAADSAYWLFTSGSTGRPKAVVHRHADFPWNCERYAKLVVGYRQDDVTLSVPRLFFGYGTGTNLFFPLAVGATTVLFPEKPTPEALFEKIERHRPTILTSVPTSINAMVSDAEASKRDLSSLRAVLSAGEALPPELYHRWKKTFGVEILDGIGSAETFHIYISNAPGDVVPGSLGKLVPGYEARIAGADGREVEEGGIGTLWIRGGSVGIEYHGAPEKTRETFVDGWVKSADLFRRDAGGRFWYCGRVDDLLKVGGIFVSPTEVEDCLLSHPAVAECAVVAYHEGGLEKPLALVVPRPGHRADAALALELARHAKSRLAAYKFPRRVRFVESLPKNDRGKVERKRLRDEVAANGLSGSFDTDVSARGGRP
ncbi:MAG TPA: benzoate-CoA ligase family protein [Candidatus Thermoplasmatota archaeon]|nr:benzoate-CoA ligase family protein [Candidatus Thermoplasmatota archaeon]